MSKIDDTRLDDEGDAKRARTIPTYATTLDTLATSLGLPTVTLDALIRAGKGPPVFKLGRRIYCRVSDFHEWLDDCATGKVDATLHPSKRRHAMPRPGHRRQRASESRPAAS